MTQKKALSRTTLREANRWLGIGFLTLALTLSLSLFLPVQLMASALTSINMGRVGFAYLALLIIGGLLLLGLLSTASIVLRVIGWFKFCRVSKQYCLQLFSASILEPFALIVALIHLLTFNGNFSLAVSSLWLGVLVEYSGVLLTSYKIHSVRRFNRVVLLISYLGYLASAALVIMASSTRNILASSLSHLAASSIASISLAVTGVILLSLSINLNYAIGSQASNRVVNS